MEIHRRESLTKRGWSAEDIEHFENTLLNPKEKHSHIKRNLHITGFWFLIFGLIMLNAVVIFFVIPFILLIGLPWVYYIMIAFGLLCGFAFNWLVLEIEHLEHEHHLMAFLIIPLLTLLDVIIMYAILARIKVDMTFSYNPDPVVFFFGLCFILPYFVWFMLGKHHKNIL